jgi:hypothetical protein
MLIETQTVVKDYKFNGLLILGKGIPFLNQVKGWLICNWEGHVTAYSKDVPTHSQFEPTDKGGLSVFGLNAYGKVIVGMAYYKNGYYCKPCSHTNCWQ